MRSISVFQVLGDAWARFRTRPLFLVSLVILMGAVSMVFQYAAEAFSTVPLQQFALGLLSWVIQTLLTMGVIYIVLRVHDGKTANYGDLWAPVTHFLNYLAASILYVLIVIGGLILLIVPGVYWGLKFFFANYLVIDHGLGPIEALKASSRLTSGAKWQMAGVLFTLLVIGIAVSALSFALGAAASMSLSSSGAAAPTALMLTVMAVTFLIVVISYSVLSAYSMMTMIHLMRRLQAGGKEQHSEDGAAEHGSESEQNGETDEEHSVDHDGEHEHGGSDDEEQKGQ
jgi:hypothetical protein